jgi:Ser/Thr protein kinase RdoA (MazF antagonist)
MSANPHTVHGMAGDQVAPHWPPLRENEVATLLAHYPQLGTIEAIAWHSPRPLSAAALVRTGAGEVFVKRHHAGVRDAAALAEEHRFIFHLHAQGAAVPALLTDRYGYSVISAGTWTYEVQQRAAGIDLYRDTLSWVPLRNLAHARAAGRALGQLHLAAHGFEAPQRSTHILVTRDDLLRAHDPVAALRAQLLQRPGLADYLRSCDWPSELGRALTPWHATLPARLQREPTLWTHNDWHASNLCWSDASEQAQVSAALDFGLASPTCAVFDLATAIERNAIAWLDPPAQRIAHLDTAQALLDGYREVAPFSRAQCHLLADLLPLVHLDFAFSEVEYFHAITRSAVDARLAYEDFLLGHASWFESAQGREFLGALHELA